MLVLTYLFLLAVGGGLLFFNKNNRNNHQQAINPATGKPMLNDVHDVDGNPYGVNNSLIVEHNHINPTNGVPMFTQTTDVTGCTYGEFK